MQLRLRRLGRAAWELLTLPSTHVLLTEEEQKARLLAGAAFLAAVLTIISFPFFPLNADDVALGAILGSRIIAAASLIIAWWFSRTGRYRPGAYFLIIGGIFIRSYHGLLYRTPTSIHLIYLCVVAAFFLLSIRESVILSSVLLVISWATLWLSGGYQVADFVPMVFTGLCIQIAFAVVMYRNSRHLQQIHQQTEELVATEAARQKLLYQQYQAEFHSQAVTKLSHDLRTPLTLVKIKTAILNKRFPEEIRRHTEPIDTAVDRITHVIDEMSALKRIEEIDQDSLRLLDLNELARAQQLASENQAHPPGAIKLDLAPGPVECLGHPESLAAVLSELLQNAFVHAAQNGPGDDPHGTNVTRRFTQRH